MHYFPDAVRSVIIFIEMYIVKYCAWHFQLEELRAQNVAVLKGLWDRIRTLWDRVEMTTEDRDSFQTQNAGVSERVIQSVSITNLLFLLTLKMSSFMVKIMSRRIFYCSACEVRILNEAKRQNTTV